ncbi:hypothetical protein IW262DRAFT_1494095 [Armillaria fumosa]|nr:hypothetical protein IW262DRAFT_1494095 [Armillaria fumosa]
MDSTDLYDNPAIQRIRAALTTSVSLNFAAATQDDPARLHEARPQKLDLSHLATSFEFCNTTIPGKNHHNLIEGKQAKKRVIRAERYKHNVYGKGAFSKARKNTPPWNVFGSLVIVFSIPSPSMRAQFLQTVPPPLLQYSDVDHRVSLVNSGERITLTSNLFFEKAPTFFTAGSVSAHMTLKDAFKRLIEDETFLPNDGHLGFGLRHQYPLGHDSSVQFLTGNLRGSGVAIYSALKVEDIDSVIEEHMDVVQDEYGDGIVWITDRQWNSNVVDTGHVAYGNETQLVFIHGDVCLFVEWEKRG